MMVACLSVNANTVVERNSGAGILPYNVVARKFFMAVCPTETCSAYEGNVCMNVPA
jgi:hypothetical protein